MANTSTSTSNFGDLVQKTIRYKEKELRSTLPWASPANQFIPGEFEPRTNTIVMKRYADIAYSNTTASLTEGTQPTFLEMSIGSESYSATQYGFGINITDLAALQNPDLMPEALDKVARGMAVLVDTIARDIVLAGSNVYYASAATARTEITAGLLGADIRVVAALMRKASIPTFGDGAYHAILSEEQIAALKGETTRGNWVDADLYSGARKLMNGEAGMLHGVRIISAAGQSKVVTDGASSGDAHVGWVFGPEAYSIADMQTLQVIYTPPGGNGDALKQVAKIGVKWAGGAVLVSSAGERCYRLESKETTL